MKSRIITLNSKYIHTALALRLLYLGSYKKHDVDFKDYTIKDNLLNIVKDVMDDHIDVLTISTYIWNVNPIKELCKKLKESKKDLIIVLGGPEVTYEPDYFLNHFDIDYVISGEGEFVFEQLLTSLENHENVDIKGVSYHGHLSNEVVCADLKSVEELGSPYLLPQDMPHLKNRILYFEASRGCPYQCQYCLSSLEKGVRLFSQEYLHQQLLAIMKSEVKTIKFLDRSFNANPKHALDILSFIVEHHQAGQQFQFEINADVLDQRIIDYVNQYAPKGLFRFEIGIQSTYEPTNEAIKRKQNFERLSKVIQDLMNGNKVDLHLDLIAGLPHESFERFAKSFDDVFAFRAKELQLGFLKMLRGTSLRNHADIYDYEYQEESPYEMISNHVLSIEDRERIHLAEDMLEKYWNSGKFSKTMNALMERVDSPFHFFLDLACFYQQAGYKKMKFQVHELYQALFEYTKNCGWNMFDLILEDYLMNAKTKPKRFYQDTMTLEERKFVLHELTENKQFMNQYGIHQDLVFRYGFIEKVEDHHYILAIYKDFKCQLIHYKSTF